MPKDMTQDEMVRAIVAAGGVPVIPLKKARCPRCRALAKGRPTRSRLDGDTSVQRRECKVCRQIWWNVVD